MILDFIFPFSLNDPNIQIKMLLNGGNCMAMARQHVGPGTHMTMDIVTDEIINNNIKYLKMKEVKNPIYFRNMTNQEPTDDGLFSTRIFGLQPEEKKRKWGYIDLGTKIIHPFIYEVLCALQQNIKDCCNGIGSWKINEDHDLVKVPENDPDYNEENTGMDWFVKNYSKIVFKRNNSRERDEKISMITSFKPSDIFITKWLVIPVFYRDFNYRNNKLDIPEINGLYRKLVTIAHSIKFSSSLEVSSNIDKVNMELTLVDIERYYRSLVQQSDGFFRQYVIGKNPDYGVRSVISCPVLTQYDKPDDCPIDMNHTGYPLSEVIQSLYPFIERWVYNWFVNEFDVSSGTKPALIYENGQKKVVAMNAVNIIAYKTVDSNGKEIEKERAEKSNIVDGKYNIDNIRKRISTWIDNYESRFEPITYDGEYNGKIYKNCEMAFTGVPYASDPSNPKASDISNRAFTWTDLLYLAAEDCAADKYAWVTRYPLTSYLGVYPTKIHVMSTVRTTKCKMVVNGETRVYDFYPLIDPKKTTMEVSTSFNETINMANSRLEIIGGDYDGDTVSTRALFSVEANKETMDIINSPKNFFDCKGALIAHMTNEGNLTLYNMTRD